MEKKKSNQHHHPKKGDKIKVEPIRGVEDIKSIAKLLTDTPRNHLLFTMGVNNGLRAGDLLKLKVKDVSGMKMGGTVTTRSEVPLARGLKSSSAAANATVLATLDAIGESMEPLDAVRIGVQASKEAGVTITGAFDDACASFFGGVVVTDNKEMQLIKRVEREMDVLVFAPDKKAFSAQTDVSRSKLVAPWVDIAYDLALDGEYERAMTLNGFLYCGALGFDTEPMMQALELGIEGVSLSGTGPAYTALVENDKVDILKDAWENSGVSGNVIRTKINNEGAMRLNDS